MGEKNENKKKKVAYDYYRSNHVYRFCTSLFSDRADKHNDALFVLQITVRILHASRPEMFSRMTKPFVRTLGHDIIWIIDVFLIQ